jgi:hypothetical protein
VRIHGYLLYFSTEEGYSKKQTAEVLGVDESTVKRDRRAANHGRTTNVVRLTGTSQREEPRETTNVVAGNFGSWEPQGVQKRTPARRPTKDNSSQPVQDRTPGREANKGGRNRPSGNLGLQVS